MPGSCCRPVQMRAAISSGHVPACVQLNNRDVRRKLQPPAGCIRPITADWRSFSDDLHGPAFCSARPGRSADPVEARPR